MAPLVLAAVRWANRVAEAAGDMAACAEDTQMLLDSIEKFRKLDSSQVPTGTGSVEASIDGP
jgi:hypothetical protein